MPKEVEVVREVPVYVNVPAPGAAASSSSSSGSATPAKAPPLPELYRVKPATEKQVNYIRLIAARNGLMLDEAIFRDFAQASRWIDQHK